MKIKQATGYNAAYIEKNKIGAGSRVIIVRSGDVIPHIISVLKPAANGKAKMPDIPYKWNETNIDIILENTLEDPTVKEKNITGFFKGIEVDGLSSGNISRLIKTGYDTVPAIIKMNENDFICKSINGLNIIKIIIQISLHKRCSK